MDDLITIFVTDLHGVKHEIQAPTDMGLNLMEAIKANELSIKATCGGMAMCATCNIIVKSEHELPEMGESEEEMLDEAFVLDVEGSRLSCQIPVTSEIDGLEVHLAPLSNAED
ncbi:MAG: ferredoxin [Bacteroidia bacterium]|jgi:ferredoxin